MQISFVEIDREKTSPSFFLLHHTVGGRRRKKKSLLFRPHMMASYFLFLSFFLLFFPFLSFFLFLSLVCFATSHDRTLKQGRKKLVPPSSSIPLKTWLCIITIIRSFSLKGNFFLLLSPSPMTFAAACVEITNFVARAESKRKRGRERRSKQVLSPKMREGIFPLRLGRSHYDTSWLDFSSSSRHKVGSLRLFFEVT